MTVKVNPLLIGVGFVVIALLLFGMIRSCNNTSILLKKSNSFDSLEKKVVTDSIQAAQKESEYKTQIEFQDGEIALWQNRFFTNEDSLKYMNDRVGALLKRHTAPIEYNGPSDTNSILVPSEYVSDCEGCFTELANGRRLVFAYKTSADSLAGALKDKNRTDSLRIKDLTAQTASLRVTLQDAIETGKKMANEPQPKVLLSLSTLLINSNWPNAIGLGLGYQDRYNRIFAVKYFGGEYGSVKQVDIFMPLSFKKSK